MECWRVGSVSQGEGEGECGGECMYNDIWRLVDNTCIVALFLGAWALV